MKLLRWSAVALWLSGSAVAAPEQWRAEWPETDFSRSTLGNWSEIISGGPSKDGIPAINAPRMIAVPSVDLPDPEPVMALRRSGAAPRAYPVRYLMWHEIVNDTVAGVPVAVTFCPLCNSGRVFDRRVGGVTLEFGVSGKLRKSDMVMYDRQTESWWQQATGQGIVGQYTGTDLRALPATLESWGAFSASAPDGQVMAEPDFARAYGTNPYRGYDSAARPFLYDGADPPHGIAPLARVIRVGTRAWPLSRLAEAGRIDEDGVRLIWASGQASALDAARISQGRDVGSVRVEDSDGTPIVHDVIFAFVFHAFWPDGTWMIAP